MILKCKMCGGDIELSLDKTFGTCECCGSTMTFPKIDDEQRANMFNRGNQFRRAGDFDKALAVYERIIQEDENDAEAHWCCALCRFGIEYVEDPNTFEYLPTCHRASFDSFLQDVDYLAAVEHSDGITRRQYQKDAAKIAEVQRGILATSQNEEPFDVFICYKESENDGTRTRDSLLAQDIYYQLTEQGRRVFFSRITLEDKAGTEYEPYIFAALNSAKVMILVTTSAAHVNAVWVKNEWSRFLALMRKDRKKLLLPCYRDMDPYDLPDNLSALQSYDMSKIGFIQDLIRGVNKVLDADKPKESVKETVVIQQQGNANVVALLKRAFIFLEDGDWKSADEYCEKVLDLDPENGEAYLGKLMSELRIRNRDWLKNCSKPFDDRSSYYKAIRYGDQKLKEKLSEDLTFIKNRNETARKEAIYQNALEEMREETEQGYQKAKELFDSIREYKDADTLAKQCIERADVCRKDAVYANAFSQVKGESIAGYESAIRIFQTISGWKDANEQVAACERRIKEIKAREEAERLEQERKQEASRIAAEKAAEKRKRTIAIAASVIIACIVSAIVLFTMILPSVRYHKAMELYNAGQYEEAVEAFQAMNGFRDSAAQIERSETAIKDRDYDDAVALKESGKYEEAISAFEKLNGYKDSRKQINLCVTAINDPKYDAAMALYTAGNYEDAISAFDALQDYKDSREQKDLAQKALAYQQAEALLKDGSYEDALDAFQSLGDYNDSAERVKEMMYEKAVSLAGQGEYEQAIETFVALNGYGDSQQQIEACYRTMAIALLDQGNVEEGQSLLALYDDEAAIAETRYQRGLHAIETKNYDIAYVLLGSLGYKDSTEQVNKFLPEYRTALAQNLSKASVGDVVLFGMYEQDADSENGPEFIEWYVLAKEGNNLLLFSKYVLDAQYYHKSNDTGVIWSNCSLRSWLNDTFYRNAFLSGEQKYIQLTRLKGENEKEHYETNDRIFLLSTNEAVHYYSQNTDRRGFGTAYFWSALSKLQNKDLKQSASSLPYWLRTKAPYMKASANYYALCIARDGSYGLSQTYQTAAGVRPALWVSIES